MMTVRVKIIGRVRFAYHDGTGPGCGQIVLTNATCGGRRLPEDVQFPCEDATPADLDGIRGKVLTIDKNKVAIWTPDGEARIGDFDRQNRLRFFPF